MGTHQLSCTCHHLLSTMKVAVLLPSTLAAPQTSNELLCSICIDLMTNIDNFITSDTTEQEIIAFAEELCHLLGSALNSPEIEAQCNAMFEENLPAIIEAFVNGNLNPEQICTALTACA